MKLRLIVLIAGMTVLSLPAAAAQRDFVLALQGQEQQLQPHEPVQSGRREMRRERRMAAERDERPRHQLTDDERRNLRRDIDQADREIYRRDRRR
jgi:hypothetical protein